MSITGDDFGGLKDARGRLAGTKSCRHGQCFVVLATWHVSKTSPKSMLYAFLPLIIDLGGGCLVHIGGIQTKIFLAPQKAPGSSQEGAQAGAQEESQNSPRKLHEAPGISQEGPSKLPSKRNLYHNICRE